MILINPEVYLIQQKELMQGVYEQIELAARTCYKSEGNIKYDSDGNSITAKDFVNKILNVYKHRSVAEHATIYLTFSKKEPKLNICEDYILKNPYTRYVEDKDNYYITTNYRVIIDNNLESLLWYISKPTEKHNKRTTVRFICSRACAQQLTRHRCASFSMESQRYCNYDKSKFSGAITYIYLGDGINPIQAELYKHAEHAYMELIDKGFKPQEARMVLPNATKTELVMTAFNDDWNRIFDLRCSNKADDEIRYLCNRVKEII